jgi:hypothetical protein
MYDYGPFLEENSPYHHATHMLVNVGSTTAVYLPPGRSGTATH